MIDFDTSIQLADVRFLPDLPVFDHVFLDPPYSEHVHKSAATMRGGQSGKNDLGFAHLDPLLQARIAHEIGKARSWSYVYSDWEGVDEWIRIVKRTGARHIRTIPWIRWSMPQLSGDRPPQGSEAVILFHSQEKMSWNGLGNLTHLNHECLRGEDKHKTEKPLTQSLDLIEFFSNEGDTILDLTAGRGTTVLAAELLDRKALGFEVNPKEQELALSRILLARRGDLSPRDSSQVQKYLEGLEIREEERARLRVQNKKYRDRHAKQKEAREQEESP